MIWHRKLNAKTKTGKSSSYQIFMEKKIVIFIRKQSAAIIIHKYFFLGVVAIDIAGDEGGLNASEQNMFDKVSAQRPMLLRRIKWSLIKQ